MADSTVSEYLSQQIYSENKAVTYRSLSRELSIHVNAAKNALATFYEQSIGSSQTCYATYVLSGESATSPNGKSNGCVNKDADRMNDAEDKIYESDDGEEVAQTNVLLVGEIGLEKAKTQFKKGYLIHVYSLSSKPLTNGAHFSDAIALVRDFDGGEKGSQGSAACGKIIGEHIEKLYNVVDVTDSMTELMESDSQAPRKTTENQKTDDATNKSKLKPTISLPEVKTKDKAKEKEKETQNKSKIKPNDTEKKGREDVDAKKAKLLEKSKTAGKLDWSKSKAKTIEKRGSEMFVSGHQEEKPAKSSGFKMKEESPEPKRMLFIAGDSKGTGIVKKASPEVKRGTKRKTAGTMLSDTEPEELSTSAIPSKPPSITESSKGTRIKKGVVLSDDEDSFPVALKRKAKAKLEPTELNLGSDDDRDRSVRAMMDVDDELVNRVSHASLLTDDDNPEGEFKDDEDDEDVRMTDVVATEEEQDEEEVVKPRPRKRKPKKVIPVGRNGLKKKRIIKSRSTKDSKGYDVTEDFSSYESVDEEELEPEPKPKGKAVMKAATKKVTAEAMEVVEGGAKASTAAKATPRTTAKAPTKTAKGGSKLVGQKSSITNFFGPAVVKKK